jgi:hypothetical protein
MPGLMDRREGKVMARHWRTLLPKHDFMSLPRHDPLTFEHARFPYESASPADYAKSTEVHEPIDGANPWWTISTVLAALSAIGVVGMLIIEGVTK